MGISRQKTCKTGAGSKARSRIEQRGALHGETTVCDDDEWIDVEPEW